MLTVILILIGVWFTGLISGILGVYIYQMMLEKYEKIRYIIF